VWSRCWIVEVDLVRTSSRRGGQRGDCVAVPASSNAHDHMYQWDHARLRPDGTLFEWLRTLYDMGGLTRT